MEPGEWKRRERREGMIDIWSVERSGVEKGIQQEWKLKNGSEEKGER